MEFTNQQKLIINLLTEIHEKLEIVGDVDPGFVRRAVNENQGWALEWKYPGIFDETGEDPKAVTYVADVLEMWSFIEASYEQLDAQKREQLAELAAPFGRNVRFPGFDGNHEHAFLAIARTFVNDLDRWSEFTDRVINSHRRTTDGYERMLVEFNAVRDQKFSNNDFNPFDVNELAKVLNAIRHPDHAGNGA